MTAGLAEEAGTIRLRGQDVQVRTLLVDQANLKFFVENPRIYSLVRAGGKVPEQNEIYDQLLELEHVRELKEDIKRNGGLIDPLIVRDGDLVVLEGNSRLAACRWLYKNVDPVAWAKVKCTLLPSDTDEKLIFALLGQYHIKGKKDWAPFEKAGFLYRRFREHKDDLPTVASELSIGQREARHLIDVYEFMLAHGETERDRWSYYDELLKSRAIAKARDAYPEFDKLIVGKIRSGEITRAVDIRDSLPTICVGPPKNLRRFAEGKLAFEEALGVAVDAGGENPDYRRIYRFRQWLAQADTETDLLDSPEAVRDKIEYEFSQIEKRIKRLKARLAEPTDASHKN